MWGGGHTTCAYETLGACLSEGHRADCISRIASPERPGIAGSYGYDLLHIELPRNIECRDKTSEDADRGKGCANYHVPQGELCIWAHGEGKVQFAVFSCMLNMTI